MRLKYTRAPFCGIAPAQTRARGVFRLAGIARAESSRLLSGPDHRHFVTNSGRRSLQQEIQSATQPFERNGALSTASIPSIPSSGPSVQTGVPGQLQSVASLRRVVNLLVVFSSGKVTEETRSITQLKEESRLHMRELLIVEQPSSLIQPRILARRHCICLVVGQVRAIIFTDRVYLFNSAILPGAKDFAASIASQLQQLHHTKASSSPLTVGTPEGLHATSASTAGGMQGYGDSSGAAAPGSLVDVGTRVEQEDITPFELLVMEQALLATTLKQAKRVAYAHKLVDRLLSKMSTVEKDDGNLYALFPLANTISHYELMTRGICECVRALLDDDRDMREACLTAKAKNSRDIADEVEARSKAEAAAMGGLDDSSTGSPTGKPRAASEGSEAYTGTLRSPIASTRTLTMMLRRTSASPTGARWARNNSPNGRGSAAPRVSPIVDMEEPFGPRDRSSGLPPLLYQDQDGSSTGVPAWPPEPGGVRLEDGYPQMFTRQEREPYSPEENRILRISPDALSQLELMLESVYHRAAELNMEAVELGRTIRNKQDLLELQQSNYRNFILSVNLRMSVLSVSIASATFVTSAFGANLISGIEAVPGGLWGVTAVSGMAGWYIFRSLYRATISSSPTAAYARRLQTFSDFLFKLDTKVDAARSTLAVAASTGSAAAAAGAAAALHGRAPGSEHSRSVGAQSGLHSESTSASAGGDTLPSDSDQTEYSSGSDSNTPVDLPAGAIPSLNQRSVSSVMEQARTLRPLSRDEFKALHARTTGRMLSDDEVDLLFDIFDADSDGKLKIEEVVDVGTLSMGQPMNSRASGQR